jgi:maleate isomerase
MEPKTCKAPVLGVILPDDGPFDYEWFHLDRWLAERGLGHIGYRLEGSKADGIMAEANLQKTASLDSLLPPARRLAASGVDAIVWACTSGSFVGGLDAARDQIGRLSDATGVPATSTALAMATAAQSLGARQVDLLSAYPEPVTALLRAFLREAGLEVVDVRSLDCVHSRNSFAVNVTEELRAFVQGKAGRSEPILMPDTALNTLDQLAELGSIAARPVVTANAASLWQGLRLLRDDAATAFAETLVRAVPNCSKP